MALDISDIDIDRIKIIGKESITLKWGMKKHWKLNVGGPSYGSGSSLYRL